MWVAKPNFFQYRGNESFQAAAVSEEGGPTFIYATGQAQANGANNTVILAKYDTSGTLLGSRILGSTGWFMNSYAHGVTVLNGHIYVSGYTHYPYYVPDALRATLWKYNAAGNQIWMRSYPIPLPVPVDRTVTVVASGGYLYMTTGLRDGPHGGVDVLLLKCDEAGNLIWSKTWGGKANDLGRGLAADETRLYVVGDTASYGSGKRDAFVLEVDPTDGSVLLAKYYGGAEDDIAHALQVARTDLYIVGESRSFTNTGNVVGQSDVMLLRYRVDSTIPVTIDIKPAGVPNSINPKSHGKIPVAILSTTGFDAPTQVNKNSLAFGRTGDEPSLAFCSGLEDVNGDGLLDVVCHFETQQAAFGSGDTEGILKGLTVSGTPLQGADSIRIVPGVR